jgi:hypothetical protein
MHSCEHARAYTCIMRTRSISTYTQQTTKQTTKIIINFLLCPSSFGQYIVFETRYITHLDNTHTPFHLLVSADAHVLTLTRSATAFLFALFSYEILYAIFYPLNFFTGVWEVCVQPSCGTLVEESCGSKLRNLSLSLISLPKWLGALFGQLHYSHIFPRYVKEETERKKRKSLRAHFPIAIISGKLFSYFVMFRSHMFG